MSQLSILPIGGTGKTGSRVNHLLQTRGIATRPVSRSTAIPSDWSRPATWSAAEIVVAALTDERHPNFADYVRATAATGVWRA
jgi:hypothetical protein